MKIKIKLVGLVNRKKVEKQVLSCHSERPASFFSSSFCVPFVSANSVYQSERGNRCAAVYTAGVFAFNKNKKKIIAGYLCFMILLFTFVHQVKTC